MSIPAFNENGLLPPGIHNCTMAEVRDRFGTFQSSDRRVFLFQRLEAFVAEATASRIVRAFIINGSFVTAKAVPNDIDLGLVLARGHDFHADLGVVAYNVVNRRRLQRVYGFDVVVVAEGESDFDALVRFFQRVRLQPGLSKGILRIEL